MVERLAVAPDPQSLRSLSQRSQPRKRLAEMDEPATLSGEIRLS
jgi:hypothetical protein